MEEKDIKFIPMNRDEALDLGWDEIDILLITGDAYVDHPSFGAALIGRLLIAEGYRVGIVAQPDWKDPESLKVFDRPKIACAVTSGNMDSMVNIYTVARRYRKDDAYSPGGETGLRPAHGVTVYTQLAKRAFPKMQVVIGGVEASLRRVAHFDYWQDKLKPTVLLDSKADILIYGMGEKAVTEVFAKLSKGETLNGIRGTAVLLGKNGAEAFDDSGFIKLETLEDIKNDKEALLRNTILIEKEMSPYCGRGMTQKYGDRLLVVYPPNIPFNEEEMDRVYAFNFSGSPHPKYDKPIPAFETIRHSIPAVRGCPGGCSFCGLVSHQGRFVSSRSLKSIENEVSRLKKKSHFRGTISDIGGAAGNIYGHVAKDLEKCKTCRRISCLFPKICSNYSINDKPLIKLLRTVRNTEGVKHVHINSGIRLDLAVRQKELMEEMIQHHVSGHLKVAPEHLHNNVLKMMRKNPAEDFYEFMKIFERESRAAGKEQYLIPLFISNFPGCGEEEMKVVDKFLDREHWSPQQVQDYIPLPMTMGAAMYYCGKSYDGTVIKVNRGLKERRPQINVLKKKRHRAKKGRRR